MGNIDYTKNPLVEKFIEIEVNKNKIKNIFLYAGGGYGKTTAMCCLFKYLLDKASKCEKIVPIYIDVKKLNFNKPNPIISYIHSKYSGSDTQESAVENLFSDQAPEFSKKYIYYILIDGLNETNDSNKGNLIDIISRMAEISNVRFVVSSRIKETFDKAPFCTFEMQKLNEEQIKDYLDKNFGKKYNEHTEVKRINKSLVEILQIPMFMKTFSKTYDKKSPYPDIYDEKTVRKADILDSYVQKILLNLKERTNSYDNNILEFVINFYLPALAFQMAEENVLNIDSEIVDKKLCLDYFLSFFKGTKKEQIKSLINDKKFMPISISSKNFVLINDNDGNYSFVHQIWRDFFVAQHIINCMNAEKLDEFEISVDENIRQFVGELVCEYVDKYKYSKKPAYIIDNPDIRKCECDFENVIELEEAKKSPLNQFLQRHNLQKGEKERLSPTQTANVIEIMKTSRNNSITADYSHLNLMNTILFDKDVCDISNSKFDYSTISKDSFSLFGIQGKVFSITLSKSNNIFINALDNIYAINMKTENVIDYIIEPDKDGYFCAGKIFVSENEKFIAVSAKSVKEVMIYSIKNKEHKYFSFDSNVNDIIDAFKSNGEEELNDLKKVTEENIIEELIDLRDKYKNVFADEIYSVNFNNVFYNMDFSIDSQYLILTNAADKDAEVCKIKEKYNITSLNLSNDNRKLFTSNTNGEINEYNIYIQKSTILIKPNKNNPIINSFLYGSNNIEVNGKYIFISNDDYMKVYICNDENKWEEIKRYVIDEVGQFDASYTLKKCFYASLNLKKTFINVDCYDIEKSIHTFGFRIPITKDYKKEYFKYSTDACYFALMNKSKGIIEIWDVSKKAKIKEIENVESILSKNYFILNFSYDNSFLNIAEIDSSNNITIQSISLKGITQSLPYTLKDNDYFNFHINKFCYLGNFEAHYFRALNSDFRLSKFIDSDCKQLVYLLKKSGAKLSKDCYCYLEENVVKSKNYEKIGEKMDVKIPIKEIIDTVIQKNSCIYNEEDITLMRKFFIACLNLGYVEKNDIYNIVCKIGKIKEIIHKDEYTNTFEHYYIENDNLYIEKQECDELYVLDFYKALSDVLFDGHDYKKSFIYCALTEMLSEKVHNMDVKDLRIVMPKTEHYMVGDKKLDLRAGYKRYNLTINLLKQLFICKEINENKIIANLINGNGFEKEIAKITNDKDVKTLFDIIEKISLMDRNRIITGIVDCEEMECIVEYQKKINGLFTKMDMNYFAFCALITSDDLRVECMERFDNNCDSDNL